MIFREATPGDAAALRAIGHHDSEISELLPAPGRLTVIGTDDDGTPLGSTTALRLPGCRGAWRVGFSRVVPAARGRGIGTQLGRTRDALLTRHGATAMFALIRPDNAPSLAMAGTNGYRSAGWKTTVGPAHPAHGGFGSDLVHDCGARRALRRIGESAGFRGAATAVSNWTRPLGYFPPYWPFPGHELRRILGRASAVSVMRRPGPAGTTVAVAWRDTVVIGRDATTEEFGQATATRDETRTIYSLERPPLETDRIHDQWQILVRQP